MTDPSIRFNPRKTLLAVSEAPVEGQSRGHLSGPGVEYEKLEAEAAERTI